MNASFLPRALLGGALRLTAVPGAPPARHSHRAPGPGSAIPVHPRKPVDVVVTLPNPPVDRVYYFTEIRGKRTGKTIVHRWMYHDG